jgi:hypothetical protein
MPKTNAKIARELARLSSDCSFLLTHLIRQNDGRINKESRKAIKSILDLTGDPPKPVLKASKVGWYGSVNANIYNPLTGQFDGRSNFKAACFTESTLSGLKAHRDVFNVNYGLAFDRDLLFDRGANPCLNIRESLLKERFLLPGERYPRAVFNFIPHQLHPFVNIIHESFDATHEREWRYAGDLTFKYKQLLFIFCPEKDFSLFSTIQLRGRPVLFDLAWLDRI